MATLFDSLDPPLQTPTRPAVQMRPYQLECIEKTEAGWEGFKKQLGVLPTGSGKTVIAAKMIAPRLVENKKCLFLAARDELIQQAYDKIQWVTGVTPGIEKAESRASLEDLIVVGSIQTMMRDKRLERWPKDHFDLVICDEAAHAIAPSHLKVLRHFDQHAKTWGISAVADRLDKRNLGEYFENISYEISMSEMIKQGYLCPIKIKTLPIQIDIRAVRVVSGDYDVNDLADTLDPYLIQVVRAIREHASFRKTLVFLPLIRTSQRFVELCQQEGLCAEHIDGKSEDRKEILNRFRDNKIDVLANSSLLLEGYDEPGIDSVVMLRPTKSRPLYVQCIGRGTRIAPFKDFLQILDFLWLHEKHNLIRPANLIAQTDEMAQIMTRIAEGPGGGDGSSEPEEHDLLELEGQAKAQREEALRKALVKQAGRKSKVMDAMEYCLSIQSVELADFEPTMRWHGQPVSEGQVKFLVQVGINPATVANRGHASAIIDTVISRRKLDLATPKQVEYLRKYGHQTPSTATFKEASAFLDEKFKKGKSKRPLSEKSA